MIWSDAVPRNKSMNFYENFYAFSFYEEGTCNYYKSWSIFVFYYMDLVKKIKILFYFISKD